MKITESVFMIKFLSSMVIQKNQQIDFSEIISENI